MPKSMEGIVVDEQGFKRSACSILVELLPDVGKGSDHGLDSLTHVLHDRILKLNALEQGGLAAFAAD